LGLLPGVHPPDVVKFGGNGGGFLATFLRNNQEQRPCICVGLAGSAGNAVEMLELPDGEKRGKEGDNFQFSQFSGGAKFTGEQAAKW